MYEARSVISAVDFTFLMISSGIEFLGKAISSDSDFFDENHSKDKFNLALSTFKSLNKYNTLGLEMNKNVDVSLYSIVRCGIVHSSCPKDKIKLTETFNTLPDEIGLIDFSADFKAACQDLLDGTVQLGGGKALTDVLCYTSEG